MPAITAIAIQAGAPLVRALAAIGARVERGLKQLAKRMQNRRDALRLAELDERMLADIGLSRTDLRDAYAEPLWCDPTDMLVRRATERRGGRRRTATRGPTPNAALFQKPQEECYPRLDRSARHLV